MNNKKPTTYKLRDTMPCMCCGLNTYESTGVCLNCANWRELYGNLTLAEVMNKSSLNIYTASAEPETKSSCT